MMKFCNLIVVILFFFVFSFKLEAQKCEFPYSLKTNKELVISGIGVSLLSTSVYLNSKKKVADANCINSLNPNGINSLDFGAIKNYDERYNTISHFTAISLGLCALGTSTFAKNNKKHFFTLVSLYSQTFLINVAVNNIFKNTINRARPLLYNQNIDMSIRLEKARKDKDGLKSFYSGHSSFAFSNPVFLSTIFFNLYPDSKLKYPVLLGSIALAGYTGYSRYKAGKHFPTDIITGAIMGSLIGYLVPKIHKKRK